MFGGEEGKCVDVSKVGIFTSREGARMDNGLERRDCNIRVGFSCPYSGLGNLDLGIFWAGSLAPTWEIGMEISHHGIRGVSSTEERTGFEVGLRNRNPENFIGAPFPLISISVFVISKGCGESSRMSGPDNTSV